MAWRKDNRALTARAAARFCGVDFRPYFAGANMAVSKPPSGRGAATIECSPRNSSDSLLNTKGRSQDVAVGYLEARWKVGHWLTHNLATRETTRKEASSAYTKSGTAGPDQLSIR